jgi:hypothetical protein
MMESSDVAIARARERLANAQERAERESERGVRARARLEETNENLRNALDEPTKQSLRAEAVTHQRAALAHDIATEAQARAIKLAEEHIAHLEQGQLGNA